MRVVEVGRRGGPEVLSVAEREAPRPGPGQVVVDVAAAGVNFMDIYQRQGVGGYRPELPFVPGAEGAGTVAAVGEGVTHLSVGDHVAWAGPGGGYAEQVALPAGRAVPVPDGISSQAAAAAILQGMTAHYLVTSTYPVREGDVAVVHAAAGGVGLLLTQLVKRRGGIVVATTSGGDKAELARGAGADHIAGYDDFRAVVDDVTDGVGAHVVYDGIGQATFDDGLAALRRRGMMVLYGAASGQVPPLDPQQPEQRRFAVPDPAHHGALHRRRRGTAVALRRDLLVDRQGGARRADRRHLPAGAGPSGPGGSGRPADHRQAAAPARPVAPAGAAVRRVVPVLRALTCAGARSTVRSAREYVR